MLKRFVRAVQSLGARPHLVLCKQCFCVIENAWMEKHYSWHDEVGH